MTQTIPSLPNKWNNFIITNISKKSADNKLTQFSFKLLHRTLVKDTKFYHKRTILATVALPELTRLFVTNQLWLTELLKNCDAAANLGCSLNLNWVNSYGTMDFKFKNKKLGSF